MSMQFVDYMRAHGNDPGKIQRPYLAGALSGVAAAVPGLLMFVFLDALEPLARAVHLDEGALLAGFAVGAMLFGTLYGRLFGRAANARSSGWLFGLAYGFLIWMIGPVAILQWIIRPRLAGEPAFVLMLAHFAGGLTLGTLYPWIHRPLRRSLRGRRTALKPFWAEEH